MNNKSKLQHINKKPQLTKHVLDKIIKIHEKNIQTNNQVKI